MHGVAGDGERSHRWWTIGASILTALLAAAGVAMWISIVRP
ncbi:hypothetical protein [Longispora urticae]